MAEPEEETDEEWRRIAEAVGIFEEQFNLARAQTAQGVGGPPVAGVAGQPAGVSSPPQPAQPVHGGPGLVEVGQPVQRAERAFQAQPRSRKRERAPLHSPPTHAPQHRPLQRQPRHQPPLQPPIPLQAPHDDQLTALTATIASLRAENARLKTEYTTRIRHLEARVSQTHEAGRLRSRVTLLERELVDVRRAARVHADALAGPTQAGEVVEATQAAECVKPVHGGVFGGWGVDRMFRAALVQARLGVTEGGGGEWEGAARGLVRLLDGERWHAGVVGLSVLAGERGARRVLAEEGVARKVVGCWCEEVYAVLEGVLLGCVEAGVPGDAGRSVVWMADELLRRFRSGERGAGRVAQAGVAAVLECEDGRVGDDEWGRLEVFVGEAVRLVGVASVGDACLEILACGAVLAPDVVARAGGVEALLNVVVDGVLGGEERRMRKALTAVKEVSEGFGLKVRPAARMVALPVLMELTRTEGGVASVVTAALINT